MTIELGRTVRCQLTGYKGIAVARTEHLFRCPQVAVQMVQLDANMKPSEPIWFDEFRLEQNVEIPAKVGFGDGKTDIEIYEDIRKRLCWKSTAKRSASR